MGVPEVKSTMAALLSNNDDDLKSACSSVSCSAAQYRTVQHYGVCLGFFLLLQSIGKKSFLGHLRFWLQYIPTATGEEFSGRKQAGGREFGGGRWAGAGGGRRSEAGGGTYEEKRGPDIRTDTVQRTGSDEDIWRIHEAVMKRFGCFHRSDRVSLMDRVEGW